MGFRNMPMTHLQHLEAESIHIIREVVAEAEKPVMLYSIGKDKLGDAPSRHESVPSRQASVSAAPRRHDVEVPGHVRVPRPYSEGAEDRPQSCM